MKKVLLNIIFIAGAILISSTAFGQDDEAKYGENPDECKRDLSEYIEFVKQKNYLDAYPAWRRVYTKCPESSKSIFLNGPKIYAKLIKGEADADKKKALIDTLMQIYDKRIELFGQKANVLGRKGNDLYKYDKSAYAEAYGYLEESVKLSEKKVSVAVLQRFMQVSAKMYKKEKIDAGKVVEDFSIISDKLAVVFENEKDSVKTAKLKVIEENVGKLFIGTGAGSCEVLIAHFTPKFEAAPTDVELLKTITKYLDKGDCTDSKLFFDASEKLYDAEPSSQAAFNLAKMAAKKKQKLKAAGFYKKAIELAEDNEKKAQLYYELAVVSTASPATSRTYAYKALEFNPAWGKPYLLIGRLYASSGCGDTPMIQGAVFWLAVDQFIKAKSIDSSVSNEANKLIAKNKQYFISKENAFDYNITEGSEVMIDCWINKTIKARF